MEDNYLVVKGKKYKLVEETKKVSSGFIKDQLVYDNFSDEIVHIGYDNDHLEHLKWGTIAKLCAPLDAVGSILYYISSGNAYISYYDKDGNLCRNSNGDVLDIPYRGTVCKGSSTEIKFEWIMKDE